MKKAKVALYYYLNYVVCLLLTIYYLNYIYIISFAVFVYIINKTT